MLASPGLQRKASCATQSPVASHLTPCATRLSRPQPIPAACPEWHRPQSLVLALQACTSYTPTATNNLDLWQAAPAHHSHWRRQPAPGPHGRPCTCTATRGNQYRQRDNDNGYDEEEDDDEDYGPSQDSGPRRAWSGRAQPQSGAAWQQRGPPSRGNNNPMQGGPGPGPNQQQGPRGNQQQPPAPATASSRDQFAAFRAFQQLAALQDGGGTRPPSNQNQRSPQQGGWQQRPPGGGWSDPRQDGGRRGSWEDPMSSRDGGSALSSRDGGALSSRDGGALSSRDGWEQGAPGRGGGASGGRWEGGGGAGPGGPGQAWPQERELPPGARLANFRRLALTGLHKGWYAEPGLTCQQVHDEIMRKATKKEPAVGALFMLLRLATSAPDLRLALSACVAVRGAVAASGGERKPLGGPRLAVAFCEACVRCDAPDVLASALLRANEAGLLMSYAGVHGALRHWASLQELHKVDQVLEAMPAGGLPYKTRTAYVAIRGAVNSGRMQAAEAYAAMFTGSGVRLHDTCVRLLELGRQRALAREQALAAVTGNGRQQPQQQQ